MTLALIVPVLSRFDLFAELMESVDYPVLPIVIDNWNHNRGVAAAWNLGMNKALDMGCRYAIIANDDSRFAPNAIMKNVLAMKETGGVLVSFCQNGDGLSNELPEGADFFNFMIDIPQLIDKCGYFDENFMPAYFEDNDMHRRIILSDAKSYVNMGAVAYHRGSATQNSDPYNPVCHPTQFNVNKQYFILKWGGMPGQEVYTHPYNDLNYSIRDWRKD